MTSLLPIRKARGSARLLRAWIRSTLVPYLLAICTRVSPDCTVYVGSSTLELAWISRVDSPVGAPALDVPGEVTGAGPAPAIDAVLAEVAPASGTMASRAGAVSGLLIVCSKPKPRPSTAARTETAAMLSALRCSHGVVPCLRRRARR